MNRRMTTLLGLVLAAATLAACAAGVPSASDREPGGPGKLDVIFVPTDPSIVNAMLTLAGVTRDDVVYDLGCGDGRIVIAAAKEFGARGVGVDLDPRRIQEARAHADRAGVGDRVTFRVEDVLDADIRNATVVTLFLSPELNARLRPKLLSELRPVRVLCPTATASPTGCPTGLSPLQSSRSTTRSSYGACRIALEAGTTHFLLPRGVRYATSSRAKPATRLYSSESRWSSARVM
jgi:ubiquinone/menaquinone biosynthesis C-methylase UbiE